MKGKRKKKLTTGCVGVVDHPLCRFNTLGQEHPEMLYMRYNQFSEYASEKNKS
jgi:hypothetical protein